MGTNYYARRLPTKSRKEELCKLIIESNDFYKIRHEINDTYGPFGIDYDGSKYGNVYHLGKRSGGWKFLWNPNIYIIRHGHSIVREDKSIDWVKDPDELFYVYPLSKEGIWNLINEPDIEVYDEYGEKQDKEEFFEMAINWTKWGDEEAWDSDSYEKYEKEKNPNYYPHICSGPYVDMLKQAGYKLSLTNSDFYSDSLRFATTNEFG